MKQVLLGLELTEVQRALGQELPPWRSRQLYEAIYRQRVAGLEDITTLPVGMREELAAQWEVGWPNIQHCYQAADGTRRYLLSLADGKTVESVLMPEDSRDTICISTQIGCPVNCKFCLTAKLGLERNLTAGEIVGQVLRVCRDQNLSPQDRRVNVVMMGMGEPLLNLPNVLKAVRLLTDPRGVGLSIRRITLSTSGIIPKMEELGREAVRPKLAISLNASTQQQRRELMPVTRKYPLKELIEACRSYPLRPWERLTFEYVLLRGVNDSDADARRVVRLVASLKCKVNLIPFNPGPGLPYETPAPERVASFQAIVRHAVPCFLRKPRGREIYAACGQLKLVSLG
ncbi:MAG: 23S rRNA (adenine(2503)-C(2))-methyltransferase RlmN [Bryobacteraceae bacterium]